MFAAGGNVAGTSPGKRCTSGRSGVVARVIFPWYCPVMADMGVLLPCVSGNVISRTISTAAPAAVYVYVYRRYVPLGINTFCEYCPWLTGFVEILIFTRAQTFSDLTSQRAVRTLS